MSDTEQASVPLDKLARVYRRIQGRIQELTTAYETEVATLKAQQDAVKSELKDRLLAMGVKSANTAEGTVVLTTRTRYHAQDWDAFKQFIVEHDALELLEKRIAQANMAAFLTQNPQLVPPGLNSNSEYVIAVRKPK
jgi:hypothetical protein